MKMKFKCAVLILVLVATAAAVLLPGSAFSGGEPSKEEMTVDADGLIICPEPRPQICTMDYNPVCAQLQDGTFKVYSNGCGACSDNTVVGYREGECSAGK